MFCVGPDGDRVVIILEFESTVLLIPLPLCNRHCYFEEVYWPAIYCKFLMTTYINLQLHILPASLPSSQIFHTIYMKLKERVLFFFFFWHQRGFCSSVRPAILLYQTMCKNWYNHGYSFCMKLKAGWCKDIDVTRLLHFWETENVKGSRECEAEPCLEILLIRPWLWEGIFCSLNMFFWKSLWIFKILQIFYWCRHAHLGLY